MISKKLKKVRQGATKEYLKFEIHQLVLKAEFCMQQPFLQSPPPQDVFRAFENPNNFHS